MMPILAMHTFMAAFYGAVFASFFDIEFSPLYACDGDAFGFAGSIVGLRKLLCAKKLLALDRVAMLSYRACRTCAYALVCACVLDRDTELPACLPALERQRNAPERRPTRVTLRQAGRERTSCAITCVLIRSSVTSLDSVIHTELSY